ncbi:hypothetical protein Q4543_04905 [Salipiger sp. 1_MG-2023]|uniref:hypothetical protein n=1 Tax=Salipiger sp. 1_MG-2023 TaxID=3062665 RepID=UPI0026E2F9BD|nr:hypothetical protein [Salipiger sp. 1_MG-2023]MDO6584851.1 hypothetical protein [Salipiger sp. 1_MG-2023]
MLRKICRALTLGLCRFSGRVPAKAADVIDEVSSRGACATGQTVLSLAIFDAMRNALATPDQFKVGQTLTLPVR